jgi:hypothetical protein
MVAYRIFSILQKAFANNIKVKMKFILLLLCFSSSIGYSQINCTCRQFYVYNYNKQLIKKDRIKKLIISPNKGNFNKSYFVEIFDDNGNLVSSDLTSNPKQKGIEFLFKYDSLGYLIKEEKTGSDGSLDASFTYMFKNNLLMKIVNEKEKDTILYSYEGDKIKKEKLVLLRSKPEKIFGFSSEYTNFNSTLYNYIYTYDKDTVTVKSEEPSTSNKLLCVYDKNRFLIEKKVILSNGDVYIYRYYNKKGLIKKVTMTFRDKGAEKEQTDVFYYSYSR